MPFVGLMEALAPVLSSSSCFLRHQSFLLCTSCGHSRLKYNEAVWSRLVVGDRHGNVGTFMSHEAHKRCPWSRPWRHTGCAAHPGLSLCWLLGLGSSPATLAQWAGPPLPGAKPALSRRLSAPPAALSPARLWARSLGLKPDGLAGSVGGESAEGSQLTQDFGMDFVILVLSQSLVRFRH